MNILAFNDFFPDKVRHGFFGRQGGVSGGIYNSLNCSYQSRDDAGNIDENRLRVLSHLRGRQLSTLIQIHSDICFPIADSCMTVIEEGDALVTRTAGHVIGCLTADCAPVLFYGEDNNNVPVIGAAHAGWGGALKGVLESTINAMIKLGAEKEAIRAAIGPCLAQNNYEVDITFRDPFVVEDKNAASFFVPRLQENKLLFDLEAYVTFRLQRTGVKHIISSNIDTYANEGDYFSYRRATHRAENDYGRQISAICIRNA